MIAVTRCRLEWKIEDMWVGAYWKPGYTQTDNGPRWWWTDIWICVIPCVPLHLTICRKR